MEKMKIGVMGVAGRMGRELVRSVLETDRCQIVGGTEPEGSCYLDHDIGKLIGQNALGIPVTMDPLELITKADAILDFTTPASSVHFADMASDARIIHVIGTTGFSNQHELALAASAQQTTIIKASNMSLGVNLVAGLTQKIAGILNEDFDIEILEMHHRNKVDAPSGTAIMLGEAAAEGRGISLEKHIASFRNNNIGERSRGDIGFATLRGGNVVGEHSVIFAADGERIEVTHKATDRKIFSRGAVKAAIWGRSKKVGLFNMIDVLGLS
ncbi:MAG: 4-hydroxy-tetrahydrodipicolinate reductase [Hyphomicrobiaceae bacterium]|nr:4-hydroxy-tetrahydrodipicolinate reductase [Hyphomicrobiaceae bacterium]